MLIFLLAPSCLYTLYRLATTHQDRACSTKTRSLPTRHTGDPSRFFKSENVSQPEQRVPEPSTRRGVERPEQHADEADEEDKVVRRVLLLHALELRKLTQHDQHV